DPASAARLAPHDAQRIQRALEVWRASGRPLSAWLGEPRREDAERWPLVALEPLSRAWLHERIARRFDAMLAAGLLDEVRALRARGDLHPGLPSMRCVGYRQVWQALERGDDMLALRGDAMAALRAAGIAATRQLAKRQLTWLRALPARQSVACDGRDAQARGLEALRHAAGA
ncbi:MAG: tRNA (adenosine(37)-N6)-dimethylallyltransferase MiaA, partial [Comamonadaceae bacterium]|nr:tRNA (adenosine(37)-N6)-dimethylallyltransferase MiaA [Comamonadaceae bacterium]